MAVELVVELPDSKIFQELILPQGPAPLTWKVKTVLGHEQSLKDGADAITFFQDAQESSNAKIDAIWISIQQDKAGEHGFINLGNALEALSNRSSRLLQVFPESKVKELRDTEGAVLLYARARAAQVSEKDDLCVHGFGSNYSVVPDLSLGRTQKLILCDESTLCRNLPEERIFEYLTLIVNCHERKILPGKYKAGTAAKDPNIPVICQAVHEWFGRDSANMNQVNDQIQEAIWDGLQRGSVAVHCLAGIHRAACIVACHFLWRHYTKGHDSVPADAPEIYRRLKQVRPHVSPAYTHVLQSYENHLKTAAAARQAQSPQ